MKTKIHILDLPTDAWEPLLIKRSLRPLRAAIFSLAILLPLLQAGAVFAHRLNVFAWEENGSVNVESNFGAKRPAKNASVTVQAADSNKTILTGVTDEQGRFVFQAPEKMASGLVIIVNAGQGHQNSWEIPPIKSQPNPTPALQTTLSGKTPPQNTPVIAQDCPTADEIRQIIREELGALRGQQFAPSETDPGFSEIIGGIGWIIGLGGIFLWFRSRSRGKSGSLKSGTPETREEYGKTEQK